MRVIFLLGAIGSTPAVCFSHALLTVVMIELCSQSEEWSLSSGHTFGPC